MNETSRETLELFVEKAERLVKYVRENDARKSIVVNPGGLMGVFRNAGEEEWQIASTLDGFLVTFRLFVQPGDGIALYSLERDSQGQPKRQKPGLVNAIIIEDHPLSGKVSHFPKTSAMLERNVEHSGGKERCIQCHFEMKFAPGS